MIILDLEWNRGYDKKPLDEILQIGAVRVAELGGPIVSTFDAHIRPRVHKKFGPGAKKLPDLDLSRASDLDFPTALASFTAWCGDDHELGLWGSDDLGVLYQNCAYWDLPVPELTTTYDLQLTFGELLDAGPQRIALWRAVDYCRIPDIFTYHNALYDAAYVALVSAFLRPEDLTTLPSPDRQAAVQAATPVVPREELPDFTKERFTPPPKFRIGPLPAPAEILSARRARRPTCPLCGRRYRAEEWRKGNGEQYYAPFTCPQHGIFLSRLTLAHLPDGTWRGTLAVPVLDADEIRSFRGTFRAQPVTVPDTKAVETAETPAAAPAQPPAKKAAKSKKKRRRWYAPQPKRTAASV